MKRLKQQLAQALENANIKYFIYLKFTYTKKIFFLEILGTIRRVFSVTIKYQQRKSLRHIRSLEEVKKW